MPVITTEQTEQNEDRDPYMIPSEDESLTTSDDFILNESSGPKTGLWVGQVIFAPKGVETALQIRLAERPSGVIEIDTGSREPGARFSTGLRDRQGAITLGEEHLREMIQIRLRGISVEEELVEAGGDLSVEQAKRAVLQLKKNSVSPEYLSQLERIFDIVIALVGPTKSALELEESFVQRYIEQRTTSTIRFPSHLERPVGRLTPASKATAAKEIHRFAAQIRMLSKTRRAPGETARALQFCPLMTTWCGKRCRTRRPSWALERIPFG